MTLEDILKKHLGKWIGIRYIILGTEEIESLYGILNKIDQDYLIIDAFIRHHINLRAIAIVEINSQIIMEIAYRQPQIGSQK